MENLNNQLQESLVTILGLLLSLATVYIVIYINKAIALANQKALSIQDDTQRKIVTDSLDKVQKLLVSNIVAVEETTKKVMLESIKDGKISKEELSKLAEEVKNKVINQLGEGTVEILNSSLGDFSGYLESKLEEELKKIKIENNIPTVTTNEILTAQTQIDEAKKEITELLDR